MKLTLETERLILRPFEKEDAEAIFYGWASDPEVTRYLTWDTHESIEMTRALLEMWEKEYEQPDRLNFGIVLKEENRLIGGIDVVRYADGAPVIGYDLARAYWNKGYATEACRRVLDHLFSIGHDRVRIDAVRENTGSNRVIQKCGGTLTSTGTQHHDTKGDLVINRYIIRK